MESKKHFSINICNCRHELPLLKELIALHKWEEVYLKDKKADLIWLFPLKKEESKDINVYISIDLEKIMNFKAIYNRVPGL
jgi:hypothetical protein